MGVSLERVILVKSFFQKYLWETPGMGAVEVGFSRVGAAGTGDFQQPLVVVASAHHYSLCFRSLFALLLHSAHSSHFGTLWSANAQLSLLRHQPWHPYRPNRNACSIYATISFSSGAPMPTREDAWKIVCEFTQSESLRKHMLAVETCVRAYARKHGADEDTCGFAALLHDFD